MKKIVSLILTFAMAATGFALFGCAAPSPKKESFLRNAVQPDESVTAPAEEEIKEVTRAYFSELNKEVKAGESFELKVTTTGGAVTFRALDSNKIAVTAENDTVTVKGLKSGVTCVVAVDEDGRQYNACRVRVNAGDAEKPDPPTEPEKPKENNGGMTYSSYDLNTYVYPYWHGNTVYNETALFVGNTDATPLLYKASRILKVTSYDLKTTYAEGVDYTYDKSANLLRRTANSRIPAWEPTRWNMTLAQAKANGLLASGNAFAAKGATLNTATNEWSNYVYFAEGKTISEQQIAITYEHEEYAPEEWTLPAANVAAFPKLRNKLENGQRVEILYYGDSVVQGANASKFVGLAPNAEQYTDMITSFIKAKYPRATVVQQNIASGGTTAEQALSYFPARTPTSVIPTEPCTVTPDLIVFGYGLNDQNVLGYTPQKFAENIEKLVQKARQNFPNCEILFASPALGNPASYPYSDEDTQEQAIKSLFFPNGNAKYNGFAVAEVTKMHRQLYHKKGNRYGDITGNNVNHPNDMGMRLIAQTCLETIFGSDYYKL